MINKYLINVYNDSQMSNNMMKKANLIKFNYLKIIPCWAIVYGLETQKPTTF